MENVVPPPQSVCTSRFCASRACPLVRPLKKYISPSSSRASYFPPTSISLLFVQDWCHKFSDVGLTFPTRGLKYSFHDTINAKNL